MRERVERQFYNAGLGATGAGKLGTTSACPSRMAMSQANACELKAALVMFLSAHPKQLAT
jgi:hypothetical protein